MARRETYEEFVEKFKPKKTTDDCMTPPLVYEAVKNWACAEYGIEEDRIVRPFWPGGDYEHFIYPDGCVVLDNPPFSILSKICQFYLEHEISFFLFAPSLTAFSGRNIVMRTNHIICDAEIEYENGAIVKTAFVTSFGNDIVAQTAPELGNAVMNAVKEIKSKKKKELPRYEYPDHIVTSAILQRYSKRGIKLEIHRNECVFISALDEQRRYGKTIYGGGLLLNDKAAAERAAAENERCLCWALSDREHEIVERLNQTEV